MQREPFVDGWTVKPKLSSFSELATGGVEPVPVTLPHDAMISTSRSPDASHANGYFPGGRWEYRRTFAVPESWRERRVWLEFEGVYRGALVYVNDDLAGTWAYGYSQFAVPLDPFLRYGADNVVTVTCVAHDDSRWYSGAGIYREVHLVSGGPVHIALDGLTVTTPDVGDTAAVVAVATTVANTSPHTRTVRVVTEIVSPNGRVAGRDSTPLTVRPGCTSTGRQRIRIADPLRWDIDQPHLYSCRVTLLDTDTKEPIDTDDTTFGIRTLALDPVDGLRINGRAVKLRGACVHHDNGPLGAATIARAEERRVQILHDAGFNAIRSAHNPMSRAMLDACDRLGLVVMDEAFDQWTEPKSSHDHANRFTQWWRADIEAMVRKDRNHPCVVMYSIGNEIPDVGTPLGASIGRQLADAIRELDPTRYTVNAVQPILAVKDMLATMRDRAGELLADIELPAAETGVNTFMALWPILKDRLLVTDEVAALVEETCASVDIAGYNYLEAAYAIDRERFPNRVIVGSETYGTKIDVHWPLVLEHPHVIGDFTWTGWDYLGEVGIGRVQYEGDDSSGDGVAGAFPQLTADTGDIDICGHRRTMSLHREVVFGLRTEPAIAVGRPANHGRAVTYAGPWSWSDTVASWSWRGHEGRPVSVEVYAAADEVDLLLDGRSLGRATAQPDRPNRFVFETVYEPGTLTAVARRAGEETGRSSLTSARGDVLIDVAVDGVDLCADHRDLAFVEITLVDPDGNVHTTADCEVTVAVEGAGVLAGFASADPRSEVPFSDPTRPTFDGRALAVVRPTGAGEIRVRVRAEGCAEVEVALTASRP